MTCACIAISATLAAHGAGVQPHPINAKCDGYHRLAVRHVIASAETTRHIVDMVNQQIMEAGMIRNLLRLTTATIVVAVAMLLSVPFFLALASPFIGR